jgi:hypothetical protein
MDILQKKFIDYECALNFNNKHFLQNPIQLDCPHFVCKNCINTDLVTCDFCGIPTDKNLKNRGVANIKKLDIFNNFSELFNETKNRFYKGFENFIRSKGD